MRKSSKLLQDCGYPELDAARPEAMDAALSQAREELLTDLGDGAPDPRYIDIFKLKYDYHNAKAILKAAAMGTSPDRMLMDMGRIRSSGAENRRGKRRTGQTARRSAGGCGGGQVRTGYHPGPPAQRHRAGPLDATGTWPKWQRRPAASSFGAMWRPQIDAANLRALVRTLRMGKNVDFLAGVLL